ncbi:caspase family protein [Sphaerisporangium sp. TRM90804]|uniref:caspase family protein n=1 Tax=Sphaerisporangium sp. TRM90804 TaxID=3031113 RepID=UPI00244D066D|nr:caspase family protein [Sphaerisporangium sp. TRM90804]MDH2426359.1 caspase family protein [Sphaerisporangium sp. TRM90804]
MDAERRYLIATGVTTELTTSAPKIAESVAAMVNLFTTAFGYRRETTLGLDPPIQVFREELRRFCEERDPGDLVVLYHTGHAGSVSRRHKLWMGDTRNPVSGALPTSELAELMLEDTPLRRAMIIIDSCHAGEGGAEALLAGMAAMDRDDKTLVVITGAHPKEQIKAGEFARLFERAAHHPATAGYEPRYLSTAAIVDRINADPERSLSQTVAESVLFRQSEYEPFLPNPRYDTDLHGRDLLTQLRIEQNEMRKEDLRSHFLPRARGGRLPGDTAWRFVGRHAALRDLVAWLAAPDEAARVVTGGPGSGKSAVIARLTAFSDPEWRATVPRDGLPEDVIPAQGAIAAAIHARGLTSLQVLDAVCAAAGVRSQSPGELVRAVGRRQVVVAVDALDEAVDPDKLVSEVLYPLIGAAPDCGLRLLLGTRRHLVDRLGSPKLVLDLDDELYADPAGIRRYVEDLLRHTEPGSPYLGGPAAVVAEVAEAVAAAADHSFLVALIVSRTLAALPAVPERRDAAWRASLPGTAAEAMHHELETRLKDQAQRARDLLTPLAFAQGAGLPWEDLWAPLAAEISGLPYTDEDLIWLRRAAGAYVLEAEEQGRSVYRLYHAALAEYLRRPRAERDVHRAFAGFLLRRAGTDWTRAHPYIRSHLATHAARAADGTLDRLLLDPGYLLAAQPAPVLAALPYTDGQQARLAGRAYRRSLHLLRPDLRAERLSYLELAAQRAGAATLAERIRALGAARPWLPLWSQWPEEYPHRVLAGHESPVTDLVLRDRPGAVPYVVSAGLDRTVRTWDLLTGEQVSRVSLGDDVAPAANMKIADEGRAALVLDADGEVSLWDVTTGTCRLRRPIAGRWRMWLNRRLGGHLDAGFTTVRGRDAIVTTGAGLPTTYWDAGTGGRIIALDTSVTLSDLHHVRLADRRPAIVDTSAAGARVWDETTGKRLPSSGVRRLWSRVIVFWPVDPRRRVMAVETRRWSPERSSYRLWDLAQDKVVWRGRMGRDLRFDVGGDGAVVMALRRGARDEASAADVKVDVTLSEDGSPLSSSWPYERHHELSDMLEIDLGEGKVLLTGHDGDITRHVTVQAPGGRTLVVTGSRDATVRVWETDGEDGPSAGEDRSVELASFVAAVSAGDRPVGLSRPAFSTASRLRDLRTGELLWSSDAEMTTAGLTESGGRAEHLAFTTGGLCHVTDVREPGTSRSFAADPIFWPFSVAALGDAAVTGGHGRNAVVWDVAQGKPARILKDHKGWVGTVAVGRLPDGGLVAVTGGTDSRVVVRDLSRRLRRSTFRVLPRRRWFLSLAQDDLSLWKVGHALWDGDSAVLTLVECDDVLRVHTARRPGRRYRRRTGFAPVTAFTTLGDLVAIAGPGGQIEIRRPGLPEPLHTLTLEANIVDLALTECGVLFVATLRGLAAFQLSFP